MINVTHRPALFSGSRAIRETGSSLSIGVSLAHHHSYKLLMGLDGLRHYQTRSTANCKAISIPYWRHKDNPNCMSNITSWIVSIRADGWSSKNALLVLCTDTSFCTLSHLSVSTHADLSLTHVNFSHEIFHEASGRHSRWMLAAVRYLRLPLDVFSPSHWNEVVRGFFNERKWKKLRICNWNSFSPSTYPFQILSAR